MALDLIEYGRLRRIEAAPIHCHGLSALLTTATGAVRPHRPADEVNGVRHALLAHARTLRWRDALPLYLRWLNWLPGSGPFCLDDLAIGSPAAFTDALIATSAQYHASLREHGTGLASIQRAFFYHGSAWALAEWRYHRFDLELGAPTLAQ